MNGSLAFKKEAPNCLVSNPVNDNHINWAYYSNQETNSVDSTSQALICIFESFNSTIRKRYANLSSNNVLELIRPSLIDIGFRVEGEINNLGQRRIRIGLKGLDGNTVKEYYVDALNEQARYIIEVEAGQAIDNYKILKDLFEACVYPDSDYLCIAVRNVYIKDHDFEKARQIMDSLYASKRLIIPLMGVLIIGY